MACLKMQEHETSLFGVAVYFLEPRMRDRRIGIRPNRKARAMSWEGFEIWTLSSK